MAGTFLLKAETISVWSFDDASASTSAVDSISSSDVNVVGSGVVFQQPGALTTTDKALSLNGASWLESSHNASLNPATFSVDAWIKPTGGTGSYRSIVSTRSADKNGFIVRIESNNKYRFYLGAGNWSYVEGPTVALNTWSHVLATFESKSVTNGIHTGQAKIYVNGKFHQSKTVTYKPSTSAVRPFRIGAGGDIDAGGSALHNFIGDIDEVRLTNHISTPLDLSYFNKLGNVTFKKFNGIKGSYLTTLTNSSKYPMLADEEGVLNGLSTQNLGSNYGAIVEAYFTPSVSSAFTFYFSSDDYGELHISTDRNPLNLSKIAHVNGWSRFTGWNKYTSQTSEPINLIAGQKYLLRSLWSEGGGGDHLNVEIQVDGGVQQPISPSELSPVLYDVTTNKEVLGETLIVANTLLTEAKLNIGLVEGTYSFASITNFEYDLELAQSVYDDTASTGRQFFQANYDLIDGIDTLVPQGVSPAAGLLLAVNQPQSFNWSLAEQLLSSDYLRAEHTGLYHHFITYTVTSLPINGELKVNGVSFAENPDDSGSYLPTFTQVDINNGSVTFSPDSSHSNDSFSFDLSDVTGASLNNNTFEMVIDSDVDGISDSSEIAGTTDWNNADTDGDGETDGWEVQYGTDPTVNALALAVTALEGEQGLSASYWYKAPGSLAAFAFDRGPEELKKISNIAFSNSHRTNAGGSSSRTYVVARYESYLWVPVVGSYEFDLLSDDGSRMFIDGVQVINNDGSHGIRSRKFTKTFATPGFKKIKVEYFQGHGSHACLLYWTIPGQVRQIIPARYFYLKPLEHEALELTVDLDGDFLTDILEEQEGTDPNNPDSDGDKLLDGEEYHAAYGYKTDPRKVDTDSDTVSDWDEIFIYLSNPLIADFSGESITAFSLKPKDYYSAIGELTTIDDSIRHISKNALVTYRETVETGGIYLVEVDVSQFLENSTRNFYGLTLFIDNMLVSRQEVNLSYGSDTTIKFLTPNLGDYEHSFTFYVDNVYRDTSMIIKDIRFTIPGVGGEGELNWLQNHVNNVAGLSANLTSSKTSPVCIEGKCRYFSLMDSTDKAGIKRGTWNHWYSNIDLIQNEGKQFSISYQSGLKKQDLEITWDETNVLDDGSTMTIRKGDSLLLNTISGNEDDGVASASVTVNGEIFVVDPNTPKEYLFDTAGSFTVSGEQIASDGTITAGSIVIKVLEAPETSPIHLWRFRERTVSWPTLDESLVLDGKGLNLARNTNGTVSILREEAMEDISILTRIGENGPILSDTPTQPFWFYEMVEGLTLNSEPLENGVYRVTDTLFLSPFAPDDIEVRFEIFVSGVTFEDGSTVRVLKKSDFNHLGQYDIVVLKDEARLGSTCHRIKVYQNGQLVGQRR